MEIRLGTEVVGENGGLGKVKRFIIDPKSQRAEEMTVGSLAGREHVVSLLRVVDVQEDKIKLDMDKQTLEEMPLFDQSAYNVPGRGSSAVRPPSWADEPSNSTRFQVTGGVGEFPINDSAESGGAAAEPDVTPLDEREPTVAEGTAVLAADGEKVGEVASFAVDQVTGAPASLSLHRGLFGMQHVDVPVDWLDALLPDGVALKVSKQEIQERN